jgi:SAM-dependent methyltransferase
MTNFDAYSNYYDLLYENKNYEREVEYVAATIKEIQPTAKTILEFGSGTGLHGILLGKKGYEVFGIERSAEMVSKASLRGFQSVVGDITAYSSDRKYDAVVSLFHVISYLTTNEQVVKCFRNANRHLTNRGIFMFDVWYTPAVYSLKPEVRMKEVGNDLIDVTRLASPEIDVNLNLVKVNYSVWVKEKATQKIDTFKETHPMRHFSIPEIDLLATLTGFEIDRVEEFVTKEEPSENSWGVCFILRKIRDGQ